MRLGIRPIQVFEPLGNATTACASHNYCTYCFNMISTSEFDILQRMWLSIRRRYFPLRPDMDLYTVTWSTRRQKRVLASVNLKRRQVRVARELQAEPLHQWLEPLLFHEMCHAALDPQVIQRGGKVRWHGREFRSLERLHPRSAALGAWIKGGGFRAAVRSDRARRSSHVRILSRNGRPSKEARVEG